MSVNIYSCHGFLLSLIGERKPWKKFWFLNILYKFYSLTKRAKPLRFCVCWITNKGLESVDESHTCHFLIVITLLDLIISIKGLFGWISRTPFEEMSFAWAFPKAAVSRCFYCEVETVQSPSKRFFTAKSAEILRHRAVLGGQRNILSLILET